MGRLPGMEAGLGTRTRGITASRPQRQSKCHHGTEMQIDALGGVVILMCLLSAYTATYERLIGHARPMALRIDLGFLSLQMFFAITAYQLVRELATHDDWVRYAVARLVRFVPAVVPAVLLSYALAAGSFLPQLHADVNALLANLAMVADFIGVSDFNGAFWRLKIEVMFSAALGLIWFGVSARAAIGVLTMGLALCAWQAHGDPARQSVLSAEGLLTMDGYLPNLAIGIAAYHLAERRHRRVWWLLAAAAGATVLASNSPAHGMIVLAAYAMIGVAAHGGLPSLARLPWLAALGRVFFPIYLLHQTLGFVLIHALEARGVPPILAVLAACAASIACGAAVHRYFTRTAQVHVPRWLARAEFADAVEV